MCHGKVGLQARLYCVSRFGILYRLIVRLKPIGRAWMKHNHPHILAATAVIMLTVIHSLGSTVAYAQNSRHTPKLILQITVDQLRGDLPTRYYDRLGEGGFKYLWESGIVYRNAHHAHANTETIVGHATLATGAHPSHHGMVGNIWFDRSILLTSFALPIAKMLPSRGRCS